MSSKFPGLVPLTPCYCPKAIARLIFDALVDDPSLPRPFYSRRSVDWEMAISARKRAGPFRFAEATKFIAAYSRPVEEGTVSNKEAKRILARRFDLLVFSIAWGFKHKIWAEFVDLMDECFPT